MKSLFCFILLPGLILTGCTKLNEEFDCPAPKGGSCKRMDEVYDMVNRPGHNKVQALSTIQNPYLEKEAQNKDVMRVWIAPYNDAEGNYHASRPIYTAKNETKTPTVSQGRNHVTYP